MIRYMPYLAGSDVPERETFEEGVFFKTLSEELNKRGYEIRRSPVGLAYNVYAGGDGCEFDPAVETFGKNDEEAVFGIFFFGRRKHEENALAELGFVEFETFQSIGKEIPRGYSAEDALRAADELDQAFKCLKRVNGKV